MISEATLMERITAPGEPDPPYTPEEMAIKDGIRAAMDGQGKRQNPYDPRKHGKLRDLWEWSRKKELRRMRKMRVR